MPVLIVDNDRIIADTLSLILEANGISTSVAYSAETALEIAGQSAPDVLLSDVVMDGMSGIE